MLHIRYDRVVAHHGYRQDLPWELGGRLLVRIDGTNCDEVTRLVVSRALARLEADLLIGAHAEGLADACRDNHYGYTVSSEGSGEGPPMRMQVRFSDGSAYVWLMPD